MKKLCSILLAAAMLTGCASDPIVYSQRTYDFKESLAAAPIIDRKFVVSYDVPLSDDEKKHAEALCKKYGVDPALAYAIMWKESTYNPKCVSKGNYGLMQINKVNHVWLKKKFGITNFLDSKQNMTAGIYMLSQLMKRHGGDVHRALLSYSYGEGGAKRYVSRGGKTSNYSRLIVSKMKEIKRTKRKIYI